MHRLSAGTSPAAHLANYMSRKVHAREATYSEQGRHAHDLSDGDDCVNEPSMI